MRSVVSRGRPGKIGWRFALPILVAALLAVPAEARDVSQLDDSEVGPTTEALIEHSITFRATRGFEADRLYVEKSFTSPDFKDMSYGIPLNEAEAAEMNRRSDIQLAVDPVMEFASSLPDSAGEYMDQSRGGVPVFLTIGDPDRVLELLSSRMPKAIEFRVERASVSLVELQNLRDEIWADRADLVKTGVDVGSVGIKTDENKLLVGVRGLSSEKAGALTARYGDALLLREDPPRHEDACLSRIDCFPMKGGIKVYLTSNTAHKCTSGWIVKLSGTSTLRVLTAGHCIEKDVPAPYLGKQWSHSGTVIGTAKTETWGSGSDADAGLISVSISGYPKNRFYTSSEFDLRSVSGFATNASQDVGDTVCRSGHPGGYWCGEITVEDEDFDVDGKTIEHQWEINVDAEPGDSGGPLFLNFTAFGIYSDSTSANPPGGRAWYSPMQWVFTKLNSYGEPIELCTNADCTN